MGTSLDTMIKSSLTKFVEDVFAKNWWGQEREMVSLYTLGYLVPECGLGKAIETPAQIGIEVRVPQLPAETLESVGLLRTKAKVKVCKDIVIWPRPAMTCWDENLQPVVRPLAIMEWKGNQDSISFDNVRWLESYSLQALDFIGYCVSVDLKFKAFKLLCLRIEDGDSAEWLRI